jgi:hypothetical protein
MEGKYRSWPQLLAAWGYRQWIRTRIARAIRWSPSGADEPGCTALIGMCHRLPDVLLGNLRCLDAASWPELREAIVVVDSVKGCLPPGLEDAARKLCTRFEVKFLYYDEAQARLTERLRLPYVFSWLSWSIALSHCRTRTALLHDYDALVLDESLARRYRSFAASGAAMQGIAWYSLNGVVPADHLATTFEAFLDVPWVRGFPPLAMFNQVGLREGRSRDYDTLLELQHLHTPLAPSSRWTRSRSSTRRR